jgi:hypothetical protein
MSTILDALRKAKQSPQQESVDARHEILSERTHDYLATAPGSRPDNQLRFLRAIVWAAAVVIVALAGVIVFMLASPRRGTQETRETAGAAPVQTPVETPATPRAAAPTPRPVIQETPRPTRPALIVIATPQPTPPSRVPLSTALRDASVTSEDATTTASLESGPSTSSGEGVESLRLAGILWDSTDPMAMINGRPVRKGSEIAGGQVTAINKDSVVIVVNGREYVLRP